MFKKKQIIFALIFSFLLSAMGSFGFLHSKNGSVAHAEGNKKTLVMATSADYPPYEFIDTAKGNKEITGFDIDIARKITDKLGYKLVVKDMDFNGLIPALNAGRADFVMAGMTANEERKKVVDFSDTYYAAKQLIVTNNPKIKTIDDLKGRTVGVQLGSIQEGIAKDLSKKVKIKKIEKRNKIPDLVQEMFSGRFDAAVIEDGPAIEFLNKYSQLNGFPIPGVKAEGSAIAFPKGSPLVEAFNNELKEMKANGEIEKLRKKWFEPRKKAKKSHEGIINFGAIKPSIGFIFTGIITTLKFVVVSIVLGFILGTILSLFKISKIRILKWFADAYTSVFRGTPLILQLVLIYFATPQLTDYKITPFVAGVLTFGLNSAAYVSEIIRAGIQAVDKGQSEAAVALGVPYKLMMRQIILPQALKNILPALMNEFITLTKESAIISVIGTMDIMRRAQIVSSNTYRYFEPLIIAAIIYYAMVMILTVLGRMLERRMRRGD
ncbi:ABC transporter substrate-binding protein/permease [Fictibacillus gelatini]|uniref:ABC transporter substrate-binding protein/permease n=1 Tax=Fictibacillus gelatini TaxID=225985 RepID=UPI0003FE8E99|nr:ABC transporter substrate-binding protein/permease [Fictibacillus gelatini]